MDHTKQVKSPLVSIQKSTYADIDVESLVNPLGGFNKYINSGDRVLLKTSLLIPSKPEKAVVTHPAVVGAVAQAVLKRGGIPYIGDSPSGQFTKRRLEKTYRKAGLKDLANKLGIELNYDTSTQKITVPQGKKLRKTNICNFALNADKIIALPKIKTHTYMIMTLATKIMYGVIPGLTKAKYHSMFFKKTAFADMLLDVLSIRKPDLIIMDGIVGMHREGPSGGKPITLGVLLASEDAVAMDLAVCDMLGIEPIGIPTLRQAKIRKLWPEEISYPLLSPTDVKYTGFQMPSTADYLVTGRKKPTRSPVITKKCTACGQCVEICPKKAIKLMNQKAQVDYTKCIQCYCCHETCPYQAIKLEVIK
jgi:uncharacterized protein (DUF362 family)